MAGKLMNTNNEQRLCLNVPEAAKLLGISRGLAYELARSGQLPAVRFGHRILIPRIALEKMLAQSNQPA
jgi:excisionase family DNA binding protein